MITPHPATTGDLFRAVLPRHVRVASWDELTARGLTDDDARAGLWDSEAALAESFSPKRYSEFAAVRACARAALRELGEPEAAIGKGSRGMPLFPPGIVGTLTHTEGLRAAALTRADDARALGVDAEPHGPLPSGVIRTVSVPTEQAWLAAVVDELPQLHLDRLLFSAKEATYKAWFPLTRRWLGFADATITIHLDGHLDGHDSNPDGHAATAWGRFVSRILVDPHTADGGAPLEQLYGQWVIAHHFVVAAIAVPTT